MEAEQGAGVAGIGVLGVNDGLKAGEGVSSASDRSMELTLVGGGSWCSNGRRWTQGECAWQYECRLQVHKHRGF